jgi:hypothetical protein
VGDPNCCGCDDPGVGRLACVGLGKGGLGGCTSDDGGASFTCSSVAGASACGAPGQCSTLSWRHPVLLPGGPPDVSITTELLNRRFAMYQLTPRHTNVVMKISRLGDLSRGGSNARPGGEAARMDESGGELARIDGAGWWEPNFQGQGPLWIV